MGVGVCGVRLGLGGLGFGIWVCFRFGVLWLGFCGWGLRLEIPYVWVCYLKCGGVGGMRTLSLGFSIWSLGMLF